MKSHATGMIRVLDRGGRRGGKDGSCVYSPSGLKFRYDEALGGRPVNPWETGMGGGDCGYLTCS